jgi:hypothetical protein
MNELVAAAVRALVQTVFEIVTGPGSPDEKADRLKRATAALVSERASDRLIDATLR